MLYIDMSSTYVTTTKLWVTTAWVYGVLAQDCSHDPTHSVHDNSARDGQAQNSSSFTVTAREGTRDLEHYFKVVWWLISCVHLTRSQVPR